MFWENTECVTLNFDDKKPKDVIKAIEEIKNINDHLKKLIETFFVVKEPDDNAYISKIEYLVPSFYELKNNPKYESIYVIAIEIFQNKIKDKIEEASYPFKIFYLSLNNSSSGSEILVLNGTSPPIHEANSKLNGININESSEYLNFFTSYVAGENGPFTVLQSKNDIKWPINLEQDFFSFFIKQNIIDRFRPNELREIYTQIIHIKLEIEKNIDDFLENNNSFDYDKIGNKQLDYFEKEKKKHDYTFDINDLRKTIEKSKNYENGDKSVEVNNYYCFLRLITYGRNIFICIFKVDESGMIHMLSDCPINDLLILSEEESQSLPIGRMEFSSLLISKEITLGIALKFIPFNTEKNIIDDKLQRLKVPFPSINKEEYVDIDNTIESLKIYHDASITNGYQKSEDPEGKKWRGSTFFRPTKIINVDFFDDFDFSEIKTEYSLEFEDCNFLGFFKMNNSKIGGNLIFKNCSFFGLPSGNISNFSDKGSKKSLENDVALSLDGISIQGNLIIERSNCYGSLSLIYADINGMTKIRGTNIQPLYNFFENSVKEQKISVDSRFNKNSFGVGLDLRYSTFKKGLDLSAWFQRSDQAYLASEKGVRATRVVGSINADSSKIGGAFFISGLIVTSLNNDLFDISDLGFSIISLAHSEIEGSILTWRPGELPHQGYRYLRTYIRSHFQLGGIKIMGNIDLRGIWIGGDLDINNTSCRGNVFLGTINQYSYDNYSLNVKKYSIGIKNEKPLLLFSPDTIVKKGKEVKLAHFSRTHILGSANFSGSKISGRLNFNGAYIGKSIMLSNGVFGSIKCGLSISQIKVKTEEAHYLKNNTNDSFLNYITKHRGSIKIHKYKKERRSDIYKGLLILRTEASEIKINNSKINGEIDLSGVWILPHHIVSSDYRRAKKIQDDKRLINKCINSRALSKKILKEQRLEISDFIDRKSDRIGLLINNINMQGSLKLSNTSIAIDIWEEIEKDEVIRDRYKEVFSGNKSLLKEKEKSYVFKKINFIKKIKGYIRDWEAAYVFGDFDIKNSIISGRIDFTNLHLDGILKMSDLKISSNITSNVLPKLNFEDDRLFFTRKISIEMLRCEGEIDFSRTITLEGLLINNTEISGNIKMYFDNFHKKISILNSSVKGDTFFSYLTNNNIQKSIISSELDLTGSTFSNLCIWYHDNSKWSLERVTVQHLNIFMDKELSKNGHVDFRGIKFDRLSVNKNDNNIELIQKFLQSTDFEKWTLEPYAQVEKHLRIQGRKQEGDKLYNTMQNKWRKRILNREKNSIKGLKNDFKFKPLSFYDWSLRWIFHKFFFSKFTNFGSNWRIPLTLGLMVLIGSLWLTSNDKNWTAYKNGEELTNIEIGYSMYTKAFEISIPIISLYDGNSNEIETYYTLKNANCTFLNILGRKDPLTVSIPPKSLASLLSFFGWIFWATFILTLSGLLRRN